MEIAIIQYGAGNTRSVAFALERLGATPVITDDPELVRRADKVIFPGVGEAATAMQYLEQRSLGQLLCSLQQPVLGICLGMQLLCSWSEEGDTKGLGVFPVDVKRFQAPKVPHMGWNKVAHNGNPLFRNINDGAFFYFVHSYYAAVIDETVGVTSYEGAFSSALQKDNFYGVQFHPEKSSEAGSKLIQNFLDL